MKKYFKFFDRFFWFMYYRIYLHKIFAFPATHIQFYYSCTVTTITLKTGKHANIDSVRIYAFDPCCSDIGPSTGPIPGTGHGRGRFNETADFTWTFLLYPSLGFPRTTCGEEEEERPRREQGEDRPAPQLRPWPTSLSPPAKPLQRMVVMEKEGGGVE